MKFQLIAVAVALSLLATPGCKQLECGTGTVEKDGECVIPKPKDCGKVTLTGGTEKRLSIVKTEVRPRVDKRPLCVVTLKATVPHAERVAFVPGVGRASNILEHLQYDKDKVKLREGMAGNLGKLAKGEAANVSFTLYKGVVEVLISHKYPADWVPPT